VWNCLGLSKAQRMEMLARYSSPDTTALLPDTLLELEKVSSSPHALLL